MAKIQPGIVMKKQRKEKSEVMHKADNNTHVTGTWTCTCGTINTADTCRECGMPEVHIKE